MEIIGIIPARYASTRFPGKPLVDIKGRSMIERVIRQAKKAENLKEVVVATDDERIFKHVESLGAKVVMTSANHPSGTDRCLEAYERLGIHADAVINIQGDEPLINPGQIDGLADLIAQKGVEIATQASAFQSWKKASNPNSVKLVTNEKGKALYFSRSPIPYIRDESKRDEHVFYKHIGMYAYRTEVLKKICVLEVANLENAESLEQLRWLENGYNVHVGLTDFHSPSVDTPEDLEEILKLIG